MELENEIHYMGRPLGQVLMQMSRNRDTPLSRFAGRVYEITRNEEKGIDAAWQKSILEVKNQWPLEQEEWDLFTQIGDVLGKTDRAGQNSFIRMMREKFAIQEKKAEEDRTKKEKLYRNLGILGGIAIVLVLI